MKKLSEYLKEKGVYNKFVKNFDKEFMGGYNRNLIRISNAFNWEEVEEGCNFWKNIDKGWTSNFPSIEAHDMNWLLNPSKDYYYSNLGKFELCTRKAHQTHYIKWKLTDNLSLRYFYSFQDNPDFIGKFVLKNHSKKESVIISKDTTKELLEFVKEDFEEIIGYYSEKDEYKKLVLVGGDIKNISVLINDKVI